MIYLLLAIFFNVLLAIFIKQLEYFEISAFQTIVFNYFICVIGAWIDLGYFPLDQAIVDLNWFPFAIFIGFLFISSFNILALAFQEAGITVTVIIQKMSLILTVAFSFIIYQDIINWQKLLGIAFAFLAIILINLKSRDTKKEQSLSHYALFLLLITFLLSGAVDASLQYVEMSLLEHSGDPRFIAMAFLSAGIFGSMLYLFGFLMGKIQFQAKAILAGILLGILNYFALLTILKALGYGWGGSVVFPVLNVGIIVGSSFFGYLLFKEKLNRINLIGLICSILAIVFIGLGS